MGRNPFTATSTPGALIGEYGLSGFTSRGKPKPKRRASRSWWALSLSILASLALCQLTRLLATINDFDETSVLAG
jgi:hypothetical protein